MDEKLRKMVENELTVDKLRGRKGGLRPSKPTRYGGLVCYAWRIARFDAGHDTTMPVTCFWDLQRWLEENGFGHVRVSGVINEDGNELLNFIDQRISEILDILGENKFKGLAAWKSLFV